MSGKWKLCTTTGKYMYLQTIFEQILQCFIKRLSVIHFSDFLHTPECKNDIVAVIALDILLNIVSKAFMNEENENPKCHF